ncbi:MAG: hypothetical protein ACR2LH_02885, partial [Thermoleophilaceae bacterium]
DEALSTEERSSALEVNELIAAAEVPKATSYDGPVSGCSGPVASYDEWLQQWDRRSASLLPRLPPAICARLELLSHLLERSSKVHTSGLGRGRNHSARPWPTGTAPAPGPRSGSRSSSG